MAVFCIVDKEPFQQTASNYDILQARYIFQQVIDKMHWILIVLIAVIAIYIFAAINMRMAAKNLVG